MSFRLVALVMLGVVVAAAGPLSAAIQVTVATDKPSYRPGDALYVSVTAHNPGTQDVTLGFGSTLQAMYTLDGVYTTPNVGAAIPTSVAVPAGGSKVWTFRHSWWRYNIGVGPHTVRGTVVGYGSSDTRSFSVVPPTPPTESFRIDFETLPGSSQQVTAVEEYRAWGVYLGTVGGRTVSLDSIGGNVFAVVNSTTYPPGFNIFAQFDMAVYGVTALVGTAAGRTVTMIARDAQGELVGSVTSAPIPAYRTFVGPLRLRSDRPVARVEWWPSQTNASVLVDNLYLALDRCVPADSDLDGDVDLADFLEFQECFNGPNRSPKKDDCGDADFDADADVDFRDFLEFQTCFNGPNRPAKCQ